MKPLLLLLCLAFSFDSGSAFAQERQDQTAEAKKLLDALAPPLKDPCYSQIEWDTGAVKGVGSFERQRAWRLDPRTGDNETVFLYDGKGFLHYSRKSNRFYRAPGE